MAKILQAVQCIPNEQLREISSSIVKGLTSQLHDKSAMWTFKELSALAGLSPDNPLFLESVQLLASRPRAKILDMHFLYFDPNTADPIGEPIPDAEVAQAYKTGFLVDPHDGREVYKFKDALVPYFQINQQVASNAELD